MNKSLNSPYEDIIFRSRPISTKRQQMARCDRAAQFSPFAAVVGHEAAVKETARIVDEKKDLDEMQKELINQRLYLLLNHPLGLQRVKVVYFVKDQLKHGGKYMEYIGYISKYEAYENMLIFENGDQVRIEDLYSIDTYCE